LNTLKSKINQPGREEPKPLSGGPQSLTASQFELPTFEDDDEEFGQLVTKRKTNTDEIINNFLGAVGGLH